MIKTYVNIRPTRPTRPLRHWLLAALCSVMLAAPAALSYAADSATTTNSGLPVPRFVALKSAEVNVRTGPGERYPISWVYKRDSMPVEVIEEFDHWRKIRDFQNSEGWVHKNLLDGRRTALVVGETRVLRRGPANDAAPLIRAQAGVIGKLLECSEEWCRLQIQSRKGWLKKTEIWGVYPREEREF